MPEISKQKRWKNFFFFFFFPFHSFADNMKKPKVVIFGASVGEGHNAAARELARRLEERGVYAEEHDWLDTIPLLFKSWFLYGYRPIINLLPWFFILIMAFSATEVGCLVPVLLTRWYSQDELLQRCSGADVVVSTYAFPSHCLGSLRARGLLKTPLVTYMCDAGAQRALFHRAVDLHLAPIAETAADSRRFGYTAETVGPLVNPRFAVRMCPEKRAEIRRSLGVGKDQSLLIIASGSLGIGRITETALAIPQCMGLRSVVLSGKNTALKAKLERLDRDLLVLGWRYDMPELFGAADVVVQNAGGMQVWEGMIAGVPLITYLPLPGHGQQNARILEQSGIAPWAKNQAELRDAIRLVTGPAVRGASHRAWDMDAADWVLKLCSKNSSQYKE